MRCFSITDLPTGVNSDGALAEFALAPVTTVTPADGLDLLDATQLAVLNRFIVPFGGLLRGRLAAGETLVVNGATGAYGTAAVLLGVAMRAAPAPKQARQDFVPRNTKPSPGPASEEMAALARKLARERRLSYAQAYSRLFTDEAHAELAGRVRAEERQATAAVREQRQEIFSAQRELETNWSLGRSPGSARM
jgi:hypothetical protein